LLALANSAAAVQECLRYEIIKQGLSQELKNTKIHSKSY
jgi:hypothetical protein